MQNLNDSYGTHTDAELLSLMQNDDEGAFTEIYERYWQALLRTAYHILQDKEAARDTVQQVFISLWQRRAETNIKYLSAYLRQATRFAVFKAIREQRHSKDFYERLSQMTVDIVTDDPLLFKEQQQLLNNLIDSLPEDCRQAFLLSREENMTYRQIATLLGISPKTVEKRISRSLQYLRSGLATICCLLSIGLLK